MALGQCPDCGGDASDHAERCPHCGRVFTDQISESRVKLTAVDISVGDLIGLMIKLAVAALPASMIIAAASFAAYLVLMLFAGLGGCADDPDIEKDEERSIESKCRSACEADKRNERGDALGEGCHVCDLDGCDGERSGFWVANGDELLFITKLGMLRCDDVPQQADDECPCTGNTQ